MALDLTDTSNRIYWKASLYYSSSISGFALITPPSISWHSVATSFYQSFSLITPYASEVYAQNSAISGNSISSILDLSAMYLPLYYSGTTDRGLSISDITIYRFFDENGTFIEADTTNYSELNENVFIRFIKTPLNIDQAIRADFSAVTGFYFSIINPTFKNYASLADYQAAISTLPETSEERLLEFEWGVFPETSSSGDGGGGGGGGVVAPITAPSAPTQTALSGGSILLLHSDTDPPTTPTTPTAADFFADGAAVVPATSTSTDPYTFTNDLISLVPLTNNSLNTIYYYLMDAAQNISSLGEVTFYVDQDNPTILVTPPTINTPYTAEWLGKNKLAAWTGSINVCDNPV